jgi:hypothetical protein
MGAALTSGLKRNYVGSSREQEGNMQDQMSSGSGSDSPMGSEATKLDGALTAAGIRRDQLPARALDVLNGMDEPQLRILAEYSKKLAEAGAPLEASIEGQRFRVMFF